MNRNTVPIALSAALILALGCASAPAENESLPLSASTPDYCSPRPELASERIAKPEAVVGCEEALQQCTTEGGASCYLAGGCAQVQWSTYGDQAQLEAALSHLATACAAGVSEACLARAGIQMEAGRAADCDDIARACHLGDPDGCVQCGISACTGP